MSIAAAMIPEGRRVYAVGDIHGRCDLLKQLHAAILADAESAQTDQRTIVYLGDYVDRGERSFAVIDLLASRTLPGFYAVYLRGNHEDMMLAFLEGPPDSLWLFNGGGATLRSYGVTFDWRKSMTQGLIDLQRQLQAAMPHSHRRFFADLRLFFLCGDYLFVHAGIRPGRPLELQDPRDLMSIRSPFLSSDADFGQRVVHGHTIVSQPEVKWNRIDIDTGAFHTGHLTCLVLEGTTIGFLNT